MCSSDLGYATVLPRPVRIMIAGDPELEAIPLPLTGDPPAVGIILPKSGPISPLAEAFFDIATSQTSLRKLKSLLESTVSAPRPESSTPARQRSRTMIKRRSGR